MPFYEYAPIESQTCRGDCGGRFSAMQKMADQHFTHCPECGIEVIRLISAPAVQSPNSHRTSEAHAAKHGFTQYRKVEKGVYEKTAGKGPDKLVDK